MRPKRRTKIDAIRELRAEHKDWTSVQIAKVVGCEPEYVRAALSRDNRQPDQVIRVRVPAHVLADRRRRQEAYDNLSLTAQLMGDPCR